MKKLTRTEEQSRYIALNRQFMEEIEKGASWSELRWLIEEMKDLARNFESLGSGAAETAVHGRSEAPSMERSR